MVTAFPASKLLPADLLGQRLCELFGLQLWDFLEAAMPAPGEKPRWRTVTHYRLRPRLLWRRWQDLASLIGVRFGSLTWYALLDIDVSSLYRNAVAIAQIQAALETIGITRILFLRSSHNNGLHLYLPFPEPVKTFDLAVALHECLTAQGFEIANGQLEIFPNPKPYGVEKITHYNGHRLPLQPGTGSCLLDDDLNPVSDRLEDFFQQWDEAASGQDMESLAHALEVGRDNRRKYPKRDRRSPRAVEAWREDLEHEMEEGWTGYGQTNHLLKTIACHGHVFLGLAGADLFDHCLETAIYLPGYHKYCRHQQQIHYRVKAWCKAVEKYYWPLGDRPKRESQAVSSQSSDWNRQVAANARDRIAQAFESLKALGELPRAIAELAKQLAKMAGSSLETVYKHKALWHPHHLLKTEEQGVIAQPESISASSEPINPSDPLPNPPPSESLKPLSEGLLHTSQKIMKCRGDFFSSRKNISQRGGAGESEFAFPQPSKASNASPWAPNRPYVPLPPPPPFASDMEREQYRNQESLRQCLFQLRWGHTELAHYIAEHFDGRRFVQLSFDEVLLLIYRLRSRLLDQRLNPNPPP